MQQAEKPGIIGDYEIGKSIGQGSYGKVKLGIHLVTQEKVAIKFVKKSNLTTPKQAQALMREVQIMKLLNHPHIVKVFEVLEDEENIIVIMEYVSGGELFDHIIAHGRLKTNEARKFFRQILSAIDYCHKNSIIHRDIKPENLLLDENDNIKITDFGFANFYSEDKLLDTFCGSPCYMPPEMIMGIKYMGTKVDVWGLGIILYSLLTGQLPFYGSELNELYQNITKARFRCPHYLDNDAKTIICQMLTVDFEERASVEQLMSSPWVCHGYDGPPQNYLPERKPIISIDAACFVELEAFNLTETPAQLENALLSNDPIHISCIYYLILEAMVHNSTTNSTLDSPMSRKISRDTTLDTMSLSSEEAFGASSTESLKLSATALKNNTYNAKRSPSFDRISSMATSSSGGSGGGNSNNHHQNLTHNLSSNNIISHISNHMSNPNTIHQSQSHSNVNTNYHVTSHPTNIPSLNSHSSSHSNFHSNSNSSMSSSPPPSHSASVSNLTMRTRKLSLTDAIPKILNFKPKLSLISPPVDANGHGFKVKKGIFTVKTTSRKDPSEIIREVERALKEHSVQYERSTSRTFTCEVIQEKTRGVKSKNVFEIMLLNIEKLGMNGLYFKRIRGNFWLHKQITDNIVATMKL